MKAALNKAILRKLVCPRRSDPLLIYIVVTNVINVIYNFDKNGLSKVIYAEKVIYLFFKNKLFFGITFSKTNQLSVLCYKHGTFRA